MEPVLALEQVGKTYKLFCREVTAVKDFNLAVNRGQIIGLLGLNGAGKTTIIKLISGLLTLSTGKIYLNGFDLSLSRAKVMPYLGVVLEGDRNLYWRLSVEENLNYFAVLKGFIRPKQRQERIAQLLAEFGLLNLRHKLVATLSRGYKQRLAIGVALLNDPAILLLDEPTLGLDLPTKVLMQKLLLAEAKNKGKAIVVATHSLELARRVCDQLIILKQGETLARYQFNDHLASYHYLEQKILELAGV